MKRPVTLVLIATATLFGAGAAYADSAVSHRIAREVARNDHDNRGYDRGNDHRGRDRGYEHRGNERHDYRSRDDHRYNPPPVSHNRDHDRRDWDRRNDHRDDRRDWDRNRNDRHDWNDRPNWDRDHNGYVDRNHNGRPDRWDHYRSDWDRHPNYWDNRRHDRRDYASYRYRYGAYHRPYGYYYRQWHRGDRLPRSWYGSSYVVYDWAPYRLYEPPYGYHWVRVGDDVVLTAIATGVVLDVLYNIWY